jgi:hypothetical protein
VAEYYSPGAFLRDDEQLTIARTLIQSMMQVRFQLKLNDGVLNAPNCWAIIANAQLRGSGSPSSPSTMLASMAAKPTTAATAAAATTTTTTVKGGGDGGSPDSNNTKPTAQLFGTISEATRHLSEKTRTLAESTYKKAESTIASVTAAEPPPAANVHDRINNEPYQKSVKKTRKKRITKIAAIADPESSVTASPLQASASPQSPPLVSSPKAAGPLSTMQRATVSAADRAPSAPTRALLLDDDNDKKVSWNASPAPEYDSYAVATASAGRITGGASSNVERSSSLFATAGSSTTLHELEREVASGRVPAVSYSDVFDAPIHPTSVNEPGTAVFDAFSTGGDLLRIKRDDIDIEEPIRYVQSIYRITIERGIIEAAELVASIESMDSTMMHAPEEEVVEAQRATSPPNTALPPSTSASASMVASPMSDVQTTTNQPVPVAEVAKPASAIAAASAVKANSAALAAAAARNTTHTVRYTEKAPMLRPAACLSVRGDSLHQLETFAETGAVKPSQSIDDDSTLVLTPEESLQVAQICNDTEDECRFQDTAPLDVSGAQHCSVIPDRRDMFLTIAHEINAMRAAARRASSPGAHEEATSQPLKEEDVFLVPKPTGKILPSTPKKSTSLSSFPAIDSPEPSYTPSPVVCWRVGG